MSHRGCGRSRAEERPGVDWGPVADGIGLAGFGVFFLVATTMGLPPGFWLDAISFWPVLLVSAGIRVIFDKSALPWGVVLGPLVVLGTLSWLAWGTPPTAAPPGDWRGVSASRPEGLVSAKLEVRGVGARVEVEARGLESGLLAEGRSASRDDEARLRQSDQDGQVTLRIEGHGGGTTVLLPGRKALWELAVAEEVPLEVDVSGVMMRSDLRLERGEVTALGAHGPFQALHVVLPRPRQAVDVRLDGPFCAFHVVVPDDSRVRLREGAPFNLVFRGPARDEPLENEPGYDVHFGAVFSSLTIEEKAVGGASPRAESDPDAPAAESPSGQPPAEAPPSPKPLLEEPPRTPDL